MQFGLARRDRRLGVLKRGRYDAVGDLIGTLHVDRTLVGFDSAGQQLGADGTCRSAEKMSRIRPGAAILNQQTRHEAARLCDEEIQKFDLQLDVAERLGGEIGGIQSACLFTDGTRLRVRRRLLVVQGTLLNPRVMAQGLAALTTFNEPRGMRVSIESLNL